jgi:hypothetical protein
MLRIGMISVNEKMLNTAESIFRTTAQAIQDLYGAAYLIRIFRNSFIMYLLFGLQSYYF